MATRAADEGQDQVTEQFSAPPGGDADARPVGSSPDPVAPPPPPTVALLTPGNIVGERFRITRLVATDADGDQFYLARDTVLPRDMAVTIIPNADPSAATVTRTLRAGRLHHPGLPQLLDMGSVGSSSYVAGQWVDGATLPDLLADGPLEAAIVARLTSNLAAALGEIHAADLALGSINPALVRVSMDGQLRLSHLVARQGATSEDDVRALGALVYLMLTATWPGAAGDAPESLRSAPRRGTEVLPANKVVLSTSPELSKLAAEALHASGPRAITMAEITSRTEGFTVGDSDRTRRSRAPRQPGDRGMRSFSAAATTPQAIRRDRRVKLAIAGVMLATLSALAIIMVSSVTKLALANIVAPIEAANNQELITVPSPTTTRSVAGSTSGGSGASQSSSAESVEPSAAQPVGIVSAAVYDPQGDGSKDYESYVDQAFDGDPGTAWPTWVYRQQFGPKGIKDGVGLVLSFAEPVTPKSITLSTTMPGMTVEIRASKLADPKLDATAVLGSATLGNKDAVAISLPEAPTSKFLVVWITQLSPYQGDSAKNKGQFQSDIAEISVTG